MGFHLTPRRLFLGLLSVAGLCLFQFGIEYQTWAPSKPSVALPVENWLILRDAKRATCESQAANCSRLPGEADWKEASNLKESGYRKNLKRGDLGGYWLKQKFGILSGISSPTLLVGKTGAYLDIWVNEKLVWKLPPAARKRNFLLVPESLTATENTIAIRVHESAQGNPIVLMDRLEEGFSSKLDSDSIERFLNFVNHAKPFALFSVYILMSALFLFVWHYNPQAKEYGALSMLALVNSLPELLYGEALSSPFSAEYRSNVLLLIMAAKGSSIVFLSLSFCRLHQLKSYSIIPLLLCVPLMVNTDNFFLAESRAFFIKWLVSTSMFLGGLIAFAHYSNLKNSSSIGPLPKHRMNRLFSYAILSIFIAIVHYVQFLPLLPYAVRELVWGIPELGYVIFIGALAAVDFKKQKLLIENVPISEYHKRPILPDVVTGCLLTIDLKNSEALFRIQEQSGRPIVALIIESLWRSMHQRNATVIKAEGDEIVVLFDSSKFPNFMGEAFAACDQLPLQTLAIADEFSIGEIKFRAALVPGRVKPIWIGAEKDRQPGWVQSIDSQVFVESARLLEIEKGLEGSKERSQLVLLSSDLERITANLFQSKAQIHQKSFRALGKHDKEYWITQIFWAPKSQESEKLRAA